MCVFDALFYAMRNSFLFMYWKDKIEDNIVIDGTQLLSSNKIRPHSIE